MQMAATQRGEMSAERRVTVAIIGTGLLGRGIASVVARAGYGVVLHDANAAAVASAVQHVREAAQSLKALVRAEADLERAVKDADLIIEAVVEDLGLKQEIFDRIGGANSDAILMSNSSVLPISQIASRTARPQRTVGTHWWNPPQLMPVVEVIRGPHTDETVLQRASDFLRALGKIPVRVERDVPGFVGNRLQHALWREALALVSDHVREAAEVDRIVRETVGRSLAQQGPFAEMKAIGLDGVLKEFANALPSINSDRHPAKALREKVAQGRLGAKSGAGFLVWPTGARERVAQHLQAHIEMRLKQIAQPEEHSAAAFSVEDEVVARGLRVAIWREAIHMVDNGVCAAATVDLMATNTLGLRLAAMGPIENADYVGLDLTLAIHEAVLPSLNASRSPPPWLLRAVHPGGLL